jgi:hypothetical protein
MPTNCPTGAPASRYRNPGAGVSFSGIKLVLEPIQRFRLDPGLYEVIVSQRDYKNPSTITVSDAAGDNVLICPSHDNYSYIVKNWSNNLITVTVDKTTGDGIDYFAMHLVHHVETQMTAAEAAHEINQNALRHIARGRG